MHSPNWQQWFLCRDDGELCLAGYHDEGIEENPQYQSYSQQTVNMKCNDANYIGHVTAVWISINEFVSNLFKI